MHHFENMPGNAKAWVYAANRKLTQEEQAVANSRANSFVNSWTAHEQELKASFDILHDMFLILMVDENYNEVSGCGIDKSIHFMQELEKELNIKLFNRMQVELMKENEIIVTTKSAAQAQYNQNDINSETIFFNKNITTKKEFDNSFMIPFNKSWAYQGVEKTQSV